MSHYLTDSGGYIVCEVSLDGQQVYGSGRPEWPLLCLHATVLLRGPREAARSYLFRKISCRLSPFDTVYIAESRITKLDHLLKTGEVRTGQNAQVEIPLDLHRLSQIEKLRKSGDVRFRFDFTLDYDEVAQLSETKNSIGQSEPIWGLIAHRHAAGHVTVTIPRSVWADSILPNAGYGKIHFIELPVISLESSKELAASFKALEEAREHHKHGFYKAAVLNCRQALEGILKAKAKGKDGNLIPVLEEKWRVRLGDATYTWLNDSFGALKRPANDVVHGSEKPIDQFDSLMIQSLTTTLLAYAGRYTEEVLT